MVEKVHGAGLHAEAKAVVSALTCRRDGTIGAHLEAADCHDVRSLRIGRCEVQWGELHGEGEPTSDLLRLRDA